MEVATTETSLPITFSQNLMSGHFSLQTPLQNLVVSTFFGFFRSRVPVPFLAVGVRLLQSGPPWAACVGTDALPFYRRRVAQTRTPGPVLPSGAAHWVPGR